MTSASCWDAGRGEKADDRRGACALVAGAGGVIIGSQISCLSIWPPVDTPFSPREKREREGHEVGKPKGKKGNTSHVLPYGGRGRARVRHGTVIPGTEHRRICLRTAGVSLVRSTDGG